MGSESPDPASEVVRAAVAWRRELESLDEATDDSSIATHTEVLVFRRRVYEARNVLIGAIDAYLASQPKNLPDAAQHPTPNPG